MAAGPRGKKEVLDYLNSRRGMSGYTYIDCLLVI
jgi:hypothetical protein